MPDVTGITVKDAVFLLERRGLKVIWLGHGKVKYQSIEKGLRIQKGDRVTLKLS